MRKNPQDFPRRNGHRTSLKDGRNMKQTQHEGAGAPKPKKMKLTAVIGIVLLVIALLVAGYAIWERPPEITTQPEGQGSAGPAADPDPAAATAAPSAEGTDREELPAVEPTEFEGVKIEPLTTDRTSGCYTFLLVGRDYASNSTDTILVGRMDTNAHTIRCISIPRDTLINISWSNTPKRINAVYPGYINSGKSGIDGLKQHIRNLLGFDVDCYAVVSIKAVEEAVDAIGGVWFDVPVDMNYEDPTQNLSIHINKGYQLLDGENAVKVCRFRDSYAGGDIERIGVQQSFLKTLASQMLSVGNIPNLGALVNILEENLDTDLSAANIAWFARQFLQCDMADISFSTMPWSTGCIINGTSFVSVDVPAWLDVINSSLNPYVENVTEANVSILTSNYEGTSIHSTTGAVEGGADSFYCLTCTVKNGGTPVHHLPGQCPNQ